MSCRTETTCGGRSRISVRFADTTVPPGPRNSGESVPTPVTLNSVPATDAGSVQVQSAAMPLVPVDTRRNRAPVEAREVVQRAEPRFVPALTHGPTPSEPPKTNTPRTLLRDASASPSGPVQRHAPESSDAASQEVAAPLPAWSTARAPSHANARPSCALTIRPTASRHSRPASVSHRICSKPSIERRWPCQSRTTSANTRSSGSPNRTRRPASARSSTRCVTSFAVNCSTPAGNRAAVATPKAWPSTRSHARRKSSGSSSTSGGNPSASALRSTPRSSTPDENCRRPATESSEVERLENNTCPVRCDRNRNCAVTLWPGATSPSSIVSSPIRTVPLMAFRFMPTRTRLATVSPVFTNVIEAL